MIHLLNNIVQSYSWGSKTAMSDLFGIDNNLNQKPQAEMWMGAHPSASSMIKVEDKVETLYQVIMANKVAYLGQDTVDKYKELPFLFKLLCAEHALSIQVHPSLKKAQAGFIAENNLKIPLNAFNRNFKDANHKPELIYALTPFIAMNGFRPFEETAAFFHNFIDLDPAIDAFVQQPNQDNLALMFNMLLKQNEKPSKKQMLSRLKNYAHTQLDQKFYYSLGSIFKQVEKDYPEDMGLFSLLILNVIRLLPGEAMFLPEQTPHAYIQGSGLEVMANSDNVLRAGLTSKYIDINTLFENLTFSEIPFNQLKIKPEIINQDQIQIQKFNTPVDEFNFSIVVLDHAKMTSFVTSAMIVFCIEGCLTITIKEDPNIYQLVKGMSYFISANSESFDLHGQGKVALVCN